MPMFTAGEMSTSGEGRFAADTSVAVAALDARSVGQNAVPTEERRAGGMGPRGRGMKCVLSEERSAVGMGPRGRGMKCVLSEERRAGAFARSCPYGEDR